LALFRSNDPAKDLQNDLNKAKADRSKRAAQLASAEAAIIASEAETRRLSSAGAEDAAIDAAKTNERTCIHRRDARQVAVADSDKEIAELQIDLADVVDQATRAATVAEIKVKMARFEAAGKALDSALKEMADIAGELAPSAPESGAISRYCASSAAEIPAAVELVKKVLTYHSACVARGEGSPTLRRPEPAYVEPAAAPAPTTVQLFALRPIKWRDAAGARKVVQKFRDCELPPATAQRALALKACVRMSDPLRRQHHNTTEGHGRLDTALDLDEDASGVAVADPIMASSALPHQFTPIDRGPPVQLRIATRAIE
jgi:hypothetical protein